MTLVTDALDRMIDGLSEEFSDFGVQWASGNALRTTQMRFDSESTEELSIADAAKLLAVDMTPDLEDLVVNGTGPGGGDALLSAFVGSKISGKELTRFDIQSAGIWKEYKPKPKRWDYTLYCVVYAEYDNEPAKVWNN